MSQGPKYVQVLASEDLVAIFGDREKRASAQLTIMSTKWKDQSGCDFGQHGAIALAEDGEWGTYRRYFPDEHFVNTVSTFVGKVLQPASGCAVRFVGQMAFCTGNLRQRSCAAALLKDLQKAYANYGEVPAKSGDRRFSLRIKASQSLATISDMMRRELGKRLPEEEEFQVLILLSRPPETQTTYVFGTSVEVLDSGRWRVAQVEEVAEKIKVLWNDKDKTTSEHEPQNVRALQQLDCYWVRSFWPFSFGKIWLPSPTHVRLC